MSQLPDPSQALERLLSEEKGISASGGIYDALFGRDSLEAADDELALRPTLARKVLHLLAALQGARHDATSEEEPGKILHEYRQGGRFANADAKHHFDVLAERWGTENGDMLYYGAIDSTPLFLRLLGRYVAQEGRGILSEVVNHKSGKAVTIEHCARMALTWLSGRLESSETGLLEYRRSNPKGLANQTWRDSPLAFVHPDGTPANADGGIASIDIQGLAVDALEAGRVLFPNEAAAAEWRNQAEHVRSQTIKQLWMEDGEYFAQALDRDQHGKLRQVKTLTCSPGLLLGTAFVDGLAPQDSRRYVKAIVSHIYGPEFLTSVGVRCRARSHHAVTGFQDYHGTWAVWPKETYDIAKGLRRQGFPRLADQLETRILNAVTVSGQFRELFYVSPEGTVFYGSPAEQPKPHMAVIAANIKPEVLQAFTVTAVDAIVSGKPDSHPQKPWQRALEEELLESGGSIERVTTKAQADRLYPKQEFVLDAERAQRLSPAKELNIGLIYEKD